MEPLPGELYLAYIDKRRPVLVVSRAELNRGRSVLVIPFTSTRFEERSRLPNCVPFRKGEAELDRDCVAQADALSLIGKEDLDREGPFGRITPRKMANVIRAVGNVLGSECRFRSSW